MKTTGKTHVTFEAQCLVDNDTRRVLVPKTDGWDEVVGQPRKAGDLCAPVDADAHRALLRMVTHRHGRPRGAVEPTAGQLVDDLGAQPPEGAKAGAHEAAVRAANECVGELVDGRVGSRPAVQDVPPCRVAPRDDHRAVIAGSRTRQQPVGVP